MQDNQIETLDKQGLRKFGLTMAAIIIALFGIFFPWFLQVSLPWWPWVIGLIFILYSIIAPLKLDTFYRCWMRLGLILNKISSPVILGILFFIIFFPVALIMKLMKRDLMARTIDPGAETYRVASQPRSKASMERPF